MSYTDDERRRIGEIVRRTRIGKRLDKEPAARVAKVNSITWKRVEDAEGVRDASLSKILGSLGLPDVDNLLADDFEGLTPPPDADEASFASFPAERWDAEARTIQTIGDNLLDGLKRLDASAADTITAVAGALAQMSADYVDALFQYVEQFPEHQARHAEAITAAMLATRYFLQIQDSYLPPAERMADRYSNIMRLAYGALPDDRPPTQAELDLAARVEDDPKEDELP